MQIRSALEGAHRMEKIRQDEAQAHLVLLLIGPHNPNGPKAEILIKYLRKTYFSTINYN